MDELLHAFLVEANEHLDQAERDLVLLEQNPGDRAALDRVFRAVHTIKGNSGFLELPRVEKLAHAAETALERLRAGEVELDARLCDVLLKAVDGARGLLAALECGDPEGGPDIEPLVAALARRETPRRADAVVPSRAAAAAARRQGGRTVRVEVSVLDRIMDLVGELVLARNRVQARGRPLPPDFQRIATGLQEAALAARTEPVGRVWERLPRMVRDVANRLGKRVRLTMVGRATELDRTVLEAIADPLVHLVRNAVDHGIETPERRAAAGKPETGDLHLSAATKGGSVVIEIRDDGRGLDPERIRARAVARGLADASTPDGEILRCVFEPGFSTAEAVTDTSGRGVGLDVVKADVERLGGAVELSSEPGAGTRIRLRLPLVLAIAAGLVVRVRGHRFVLPHARLREIAHAAFAPGATSVELRGRRVPLVRLADALDLGPGHDGGLVAVLEAGDRRYGLVIDAVEDTRDLVVKPLPPPLDALPVYAGATVLGDGSAALILDAERIADDAGIAPGVGRAPVAPVAADAEVAEPFLLFEPDDGARYALPLAAVDRIEEFPGDAIEAGGVYVGGALLPLVRAAGDPADASFSGRVQVAIHTGRRGRRLGLVVSRIVDVARFAPDPDPATAAPGVLGTQTVAGHPVRLVDLLQVTRWDSD